MLLIKGVSDTRNLWVSSKDARTSPVLAVGKRLVCQQVSTLGAADSPGNVFPLTFFKIGVFKMVMSQNRPKRVE